MNRLDILALHGLERHEAHVGPGHRLTNRLGSATVISIVFDIRLYKLGAREETATIFHRIVKNHAPLRGKEGQYVLSSLRLAPRSGHC